MARPSGYQVPSLAADFWERPDVETALADRDMGALFRLLQQRAGVSQTQIATATGLAQGRVSEISRGRRVVASLDLFCRIADGLDVPDHGRVLLGIAPRQLLAQPFADRARSSDDHEHDLLARIANARTIGAGLVRLLQDETNSLRLMDRTLGAPPVMRKAGAHIAHVQTCVKHSLVPATRRQLAAVLADTAALAAWQAIDVGRLPTAWDHFELAIAAAREAEDESLLAFARGEQAYVLLDLGLRSEAIERVQTARDAGGRKIGYRLRAWLRAAEAEMAAAAGQEAACRSALDLAESELTRAPSDATLPYLALDAGHLARWRGNCLVQLGDRQAIADLSAALTVIDSSFTRAQAGLRCDMALAMHRSGERAESRRELGRAAELARLTGSVRQQRRVAAIARQINQAA